jgi:two-component system phosphate regulon response regulator PhoB
MHLAENRIYRKEAVNARHNLLHAGVSVSLLCIRERESSAGRLALDHLRNEGFGVRTISIGIDALRQIEELHPSLIIIETTMSRARALDLCRGIRRVHSLGLTPVILFAANASEEERVLGLESGADDYITAPSSAREVAARVRAVLRRFTRQDIHSWIPHERPAVLPPLIGTPCAPIRSGDIEIDSAAMRISVCGSEVVTTDLEFRLLYYLLHNQARVFTRDQLLDAVWGTQNVELRSVDACVRRLRRKIEPDPLRPIYLKTVRGAGYCLRVGPARLASSDRLPVTFPIQAPV